MILFQCNPEESLIRFLIEESERAWLEHEHELDLQREAELDAETPIVIEPEVIPAEVVAEWQAYR
jgi:hypothetical protein